MDNAINQRIKQIIDELCQGNASEFARVVGVKSSVPRDIIGPKQSKPGFDIIRSIVENSTLSISAEWLLTGFGEMHKSESSVKAFIPDEFPKQIGRLYRAPIYNALPVSAGNMGLSTYEDENPTGYAYTVMPGVKFFPVVGYSFEPIIPAGHYIGIREVDNWQAWERIDPEKIFLIVTHEDRMMKRIRIDKEDSNKIWCTSPNYEEFDIWKVDILEIHHVFFYGKMV